MEQMRWKTLIKKFNLLYKKEKKNTTYYLKNKKNYIN